MWLTSCGLTSSSWGSDSLIRYSVHSRDVMYDHHIIVSRDYFSTFVQYSLMLESANLQNWCCTGSNSLDANMFFFLIKLNFHQTNNVVQFDIHTLIYNNRAHCDSSLNKQWPKVISQYTNRNLKTIHKVFSGHYMEMIRKYAVRAGQRNFTTSNSLECNIIFRWYDLYSNK